MRLQWYINQNQLTMTTTVLKIIAIGAVIGAVAFFAPVVLFTFLLAAMLMRLFFFRRFSHWNFAAHKLAFADKIRSMSDEEYASFKTRITSYNAHHCAGHHSQTPNNK